ncbi:carboxymuconolactone decarboxylase family protein [Phocoenobacter skyensis]|uniref:Alkylhydroperoxidase AhpD family core domain-containing protein n=1 Tax=Phocoenobacter skyensis TaxID=97481 RepID=A0A1H7VFJ4_9PAST|nr:carboxymuconolactone decarboxylase family protein [Pasteurella skyensis]MDP8079348.1 carboxymuconolactone decarboxylase family protein [Pasteurella skyensis]MDP8085220.1 carboxymuconolactone decarboxylase family protein [Pasteurella skyensis]MDP8162675.1 carboxymuconolactone decarboxylase family protein [Pasteurella skyensis]MDP8171411.1 carboxymuconolactone decarboxylase family protein [Pasteurella skyensis]MDP8173443.1 carboxymuconolactone decarboxylase family protein [Pasteurella skyensi
MSYNYTELTRNLNEKLGQLRAAIPDSMQGFSKMAQSALKEDALSFKQKEMMAMSIAIAMRCQGCLGFHAKALVKAGCTRAEFMEMLQVAIYMGGGPSVMTAAEALMAYEEFGGEKE